MDAIDEPLLLVTSSETAIDGDLLLDRGVGHGRSLGLLLDHGVGHEADAAADCDTSTCITSDGQMIKF